MYCKKCGGKLESYASNCAFCGTPVEKYDTKMEYVKQEKNGQIKHMTTLKWIGLELLPTLVPIGTLIYLVLILKWAFGSTKDTTLKTYARSRIVIFVFAIVLVAGLAVIIGSNQELMDSLKNALK